MCLVWLSNKHSDMCNREKKREYLMWKNIFFFPRKRTGKKNWKKNTIFFVGEDYFFLNFNLHFYTAFKQNKENIFQDIYVTGLEKEKIVFSSLLLSLFRLYEKRM